MVKSYIGNYDEALSIFKQTSSFFEGESLKNMHPNVLYGNKRGYFNSLHQMIICYRNLGNYNVADSLTAVGLSSTVANKNYQQEYGYFLKEEGISEYHRKDYGSSLNSLKVSLKYISNANDFAWVTICYFYMGKSYKKLGEIDSAKQYFQKVDSVFQKHNFILPELRNNYEQLIDLYKNKNDNDKQLYYTNQLLKADRAIDQDFAYLSTKIHRQYDYQALVEEKSRLEENSRHFAWKMWLLGLIAAICGGLLLRQAITRIKYWLKKDKTLKQGNLQIGFEAESGKDGQKLDLEKKVVEDLLVKLHDFEKNLGFTETGLTLNKLASKFNTNSTYLSQIVNERKGTNFNGYIGELRIKYITSKLSEEKKYLNYKIETLAEMCGIASRSNFSKLFQKINGVRPADFIKKLVEGDGEENPAIKKQ